MHIVCEDCGTEYGHPDLLNPLNLEDQARTELGGVLGWCPRCDGACVEVKSKLDLSFMTDRELIRMMVNKADDQLEKISMLEAEVRAVRKALVEIADKLHAQLYNYQSPSKKCNG